MDKPTEVDDTDAMASSTVENDCHETSEDPLQRASWPRLPGHVVKSAGRALQILELFDDTRREANVVEISRRLGYPQSSTSMLLSSLTELGYLQFDPHHRTYYPTTRVRLLGNWINPSLFGDSKLPRLVASLNEETGHAVFLAVRHGLQSQYIHVAQATTTLRLHLTCGTLRPLATSVSGQALLSTLPDTEVAKLLRRINAERSAGMPSVEQRPLLESLAAIREKGYAFTKASTVTPGAAVIAMVLPVGIASPRLVLGMGGATEAMAPQAETLISLMQELIARCSASQEATLA